jgi:hypothetical protein
MERLPAQYTAGYRLAASPAGTLPAENTFTFVPLSYDFRFLLWCDSVRGSRLNAPVNGQTVVSDYCEPAGKRPEILPFVHSQTAEQKKRYWEYFGVRLNVPLTVTVTVYSGVDAPDPSLGP